MYCFGHQYTTITCHGVLVLVIVALGFVVGVGLRLATMLTTAVSGDHRSGGAGAGFRVWVFGWLN